MSSPHNQTESEKPSETAAAEADELGYARVLVEIGELVAAEGEIDRLLAERPDSLAARTLLARVKHRRGELSEAFACWAQVRAAQPETGSAHMRLITLLHLAEDPEKGAGEFLAVGRSHLWRKPTGMLELEKVFRRFVEHRPGLAKEAARLLMRKYKTTDPDLFKLAALAEAWVSELSGDLEAAAGSLERLGEERGLEDDVDRALALVRVYEQLATPTALRRAVHVCQFLARSVDGDERVAALGRLARLHRVLGDGDEADRRGAQFLRAFQRQLQRVSRAEATRVAAERYVPLPRLLEIRFADDGAPERPPRRQRALLLALEGRLAEASRLLAEGDGALDVAYRAEIARLTGDRRAAIDLALELLRRRPEEVWAASWLLEEADDDPAVVAWLREPGIEPALCERLESLAQRASQRADVWRQLAALHQIAGRPDEAERCRQRAVLAGTAELPRPGVVSRALAAAVFRFAGGAHGLIHEVWAERRPAPAARGGQLDEVLGAVSPELEKVVRNVFFSVREYAQAKFPHRAAEIFDATYAFKITKEDEPSHGQSAGLPTALAFLSLFLGRPLPRNLASSGVLVADAHDVLVVRAVGDVQEKVRGAYGCALRTLILPAENQPELEASPLVPAAVSRQLVRFASTLDEAITAAFGREVWEEMS